MFVTYGVYRGFGDLFSRAAASGDLAKLFTIDGGTGYTSWISLTVLAMVAIFVLPRQFQVLVVENVDERHVKKAVWLFPLYLLLINIFVLPIAFGGLLHFPLAAWTPTRSCWRCRWPSISRRSRCSPSSAGFPPRPA